MTRTALRQSVSYVEFFSSLAAGAIVTWIIWMIAKKPMTYLGDNAQLSIVRRNNQWTEILLNNLPVLFAIIAIIGSIAIVVYVTRF